LCTDIVITVTTTRAGIVYEATWRGLHVAVKRMVFSLLTQDDGCSDAAARTRAKILREAALNQSLSHPNIVATYSHDMRQLGEGAIADWQLLIIQELCNGGSLLSALQSGW
jgi:serine/threonine protein kinase